MSVEKLNIELKADPKKVVLQFLKMKPKRTKSLLNRLLNLNNGEVDEKLKKVISEFSYRHKNFEADLCNNFKKIEHFIEDDVELSDNQKLLIGAYFSKEYSIESAALFNPSIVPHPDQSGIEDGELKFVMSLRATGEGHISSIEFREGVISKNGDVKLIPDTRHKELADIAEFPYGEIKRKKLSRRFINPFEKVNIKRSNYRCSFDENSLLKERVLFPVSKSEQMGMEDARFVKFDNNNGSKYFATYTAYDGKKFRSQLIETDDFRSFEIGTLHGRMIKDKGKALFPRKVNGKYFITSRQDGENLYMMESDNLYQWDNVRELHKPKELWEFLQLGNCGSPIETKEGWLLLTHAVGPLRKYVMSALLLDLDNPYKVIGVLKEPLIQPDENEREGYVPNVVYSCGSLVHNNNLTIPYAMSDSACGFARIELDKLFKLFS